jgi:uncharacterized membrane protein (UPF0127 family)
MKLGLSAFRRLFFCSIVMLAMLAGGLQAQGLRPHEPFDPAKSQTLATSTLVIQSGTQSHRFVVELADTDKQRNIGLMHRNALAADHGMLFNFHREQVTRFWMRNTFIPLDMIFISARGEIVAIAENTTPHSDTPVGPSAPIGAVLEVPGGTSARLGLKAGDIVHHRIFRNAPPS